MLPGVPPLRAEGPSTWQAVACAFTSLCLPPEPTHSLPPAVPGSAVHSLTHVHPSAVFLLLQVLHLGTCGFLLLHLGTLLPVLVSGPLASVFGDILPHSPRMFYSRTPCAFIPGPP